MPQRKMDGILHTIVWISLGAIAGANLRYYLSQVIAKWTASTFPWGTLAINVTGSFLLGFYLFWSAGRATDARWRLLVAVGFCGGYTTFSSFAYETVALFEHGEWLQAVANVAASNTLSLIAVGLGALVARSL